MTTTSSLTTDALIPEARVLTDRYDFVAELGRGGMGIVYLARDCRTNDLVAIKLLGAVYAGNAESALRFAREARTMAALDHPNIVRTVAIEPLTAGALAIVSEYVPGQTLRSLLRAAGPLPFDRTVGILRDVAAALAHAHLFRIVHRDVKPENIFVDAATGRALLADFGIARPIDSDTQLTSDGSSLGTPSYMAPEQVRGDTLDERADVYSLGMVAWEMLAGQRPWAGETLYEILHKQQHEQLPLLAQLRPDIPMYLLVAIDVALSKLPAERWANGAEFLARLTPVPVSLPSRAVCSTGLSFTDDATIPIVPRAIPDEATLSQHYEFDAKPVSGTDTLELFPVTPAPASNAGDAAAMLPATTAALTDASVTGPTPVHVESASYTRSPRFIKQFVAFGTVVTVAAALVAAQKGMRTHGATTTAAADTQTKAGLAPPVVPTLPQQATPVAARMPNLQQTVDVGGELHITNRAKPGANKAVTSNRAADVVRQTRNTSRALPGSTTVVDTASMSDTSPCRIPTAVAQRGCLSVAIDSNDAALTRTYHALIAEMRNAAGGKKEPAEVLSLRREQRRWIDVRDRACRSNVGAPNASLWGAERVPCFARMSNERDQQLSRRFQEKRSRR